MMGCDRGLMFLYAVAALFVAVQSRAVNISNTWMLPEEGFPVFYRYFRDRISWYEADAVCQFHHANLVTADSSSQYDAIRAYLKELDIIEKVWIGLSKSQDKPDFLWTDFRPLSGEGHWQESLPTGDGQSLCAVMDPGADFLWRTLPCGGPDVAAFICELPIPPWALGPKGCLLTELPSLTVLYIPEQSALELTSDCGLDGTKRIACKGNADREEMLRQLTCVIPNEDLDEDKTTKTSTSDYFETSTWDDKTTTLQSLSSNTIISEESTRHRRETEDTLSPVSTRSPFKEVTASDASWRQEKAVLTTQQMQSLEEHVTPTSATDGVDLESTTLTESGSKTTIIIGLEGRKEELTTDSTIEKLTPTTPQTEVTSKIVHLAPTQTAKNQSPINAKLKAIEGTITSTTTAEGNVEDYPSAINQGQLFSIIENGTMFDIIELNETEQELMKSSTHQSSTALPTKKFYTKKPVQPTKKIPSKETNKPKRTTPPENATTKRVPSVDEIEEKLTKEFEMMPDIKDTSLKLNRTFRKELPPITITDEHTDALESGSQFGVPRIINFTVTNVIDSEDGDGFQRDQPQQEDASSGNITEALVISGVTPSVVKKNEPKLMDDTSESSSLLTPTANLKPFKTNDPNLPLNNHSEQLNDTSTEKEKSTKLLAKEDFLPKPLLGNHKGAIATSASATTTPHPMSYDGGYSEHPFPSDEPKKVNRHRSLHPNKARKFYPYFFSRMLG